MLLCLKMDKVKIHFTWSLQVRYPTEHGLPVKSGRSAEKSCPFGKVNGHGRFCPVPGDLRNPCPSTATSWSWKCHFFPYTVTAERSSTADGWRWRLALSTQPPFIVGTWKGSCWEEYSAVANTELQELKTDIYKIHFTQNQVQCAALQLPVLAYMDVAEIWSSLWILVIWNLWYKT